MTPSLYGLPVHISEHLPPDRPPFIDRQKVRSPARAVRRWRQGKRATNPWTTVPCSAVFKMHRGPYWGTEVLVMTRETWERLKCQAQNFEPFDLPPPPPPGFSDPEETFRVHTRPAAAGRPGEVERAVYPGPERSEGWIRDLAPIATLMRGLREQLRDVPGELIVGGLGRGPVRPGFDHVPMADLVAQPSVSDLIVEATRRNMDAAIAGLLGTTTVAKPEDRKPFSLDEMLRTINDFTPIMRKP